MNHIPYKGSGQATTDLLGGQVMMSIPGTAGMVGHIKAGKLRALAVTGATRSPQLPDVPTRDGSGRSGLTRPTSGWDCSRPRARPRRSSTASTASWPQVLATTEVKTYMATAGIEIVGSTPAEFGRFFRAERDLWAKVVRETGAKID